MILLESNDSAGSMDASAYRFDEAGLRALYERLNQHPFELETSGEEAMKGTIDAGEGGTLFLMLQCLLLLKLGVLFSGTRCFFWQFY